MVFARFHINYVRLLSTEGVGVDVFCVLLTSTHGGLSKKVK